MATVSDSRRAVLALLLGACVLPSCGKKTHRSYSGDPLPRERVAILREYRQPTSLLAPITGEVKQPSTYIQTVDDMGMLRTVREVELLPGKHRVLAVAYLELSGTSQRIEPGTVEFEAVAGRVYELRCEMLDRKWVYVVREVRD